MGAIRFMRLLYAFLLLTVAILGTSVNGETLLEAWDNHRMEMIVQERAPDCGPIAFFDSLIIGPKNLARIIRDLPGKTNKQKYQAFLDQYGTKPSIFNASLPRYNPDDGLDIRNLAEMANDLINRSGRNFEATFIDSNDSHPIRSAMRNFMPSLFERFAPILSMATPDEEGRPQGHAVVLLNVNQFSFEQGTMNVTVFEPNTFDLFTFDLTEKSGQLVASVQKIGPLKISSGLIILDGYMVLKQTP
jgi:hypothetical protein